MASRLFFCSPPCSWSCSKHLKNHMVTMPVRQEKSLNFFFIITFLYGQKSSQKRIAPCVFGCPRTPSPQHHFLLKSTRAAKHLGQKNIAIYKTVSDKCIFDITMQKALLILKNQYSSPVINPSHFGYPKAYSTDRRNSLSDQRRV